MGPLGNVTPKGVGPGAQFPRTPPLRKGPTYVMPHTSVTRDPIPDQGDLIGIRHKVHPSDFHQQGKVYADPGVHRNFFTNVDGINAIAERRFGTVVRKVIHLSQIGIKRTIPTRRQANPANVETPPATTFGDMSTLSGYSGAEVRSMLKAI